MMSIRKALARVALALCCAAPGSLAQAQAKYMWASSRAR